MNWIQNHLLTCPFKLLTGFDCPLCGFQRSLLLLIHGNISESIHLYPAAIPILFCFLILPIKKRFSHFKWFELAKNTFLLVTVSIILISYLIKIV